MKRKYKNQDGAECSRMALGVGAEADVSEEENASPSSAEAGKDNRQNLELTGENPGGLSPARESSGDGKAFACTLCDRSFTTKTGLGVHRRMAHPAAFHEQAALLNAGRRGKTWSVEESELLSRGEAEMILARPSTSKKQYVDVAKLAELHRRSVDSIKGQRKKASHKARVLELCKEIAEERATEAARAIQQKEAQKDDDGGVTEADGGAVGDRLKTQCEYWQKYFQDSGADFVRVTKIPICEIRGAPTVPINQEKLDQRWGEWIEEQLGVLATANRNTLRRRPTSERAKGPQQVGKQSHYRPRSLRKQRRAKLWADTQKGFRKDPGGTVKQILKGEVGTSRGVCDPTELGEHWRAVFETDSETDPRSTGCSPENVLSELARPITLVEVGLQIDRVKANAAGPDRVDIKGMKRLNKSQLLAWFNLFLYAGVAPRQLLRGNCSLIPKVEGAALPKQYRPIVVTSKILRVFHALISRRLRAVRLPDEQRGFRPVDGTFENAYLLRNLLSNSKQERRALYVAFVDLSNAFGAISQDTIFKAAVRMGVPGPIIRYLRFVYKESRVVVRATGAECHVSRGILQGDPLSSDLFNFAMSMVCEELDPRIGFKLAGEPVSYGAYADDTFVTAETRVGLKRQVSLLAASLQKGGLEMNALKCSTVTIEVDKRAKRWYVDTEAYLKVGKETVPALSLSGTYKYLGIQVGAIGVDSSGVKDHLALGLERLTEARLKPQQKLFALRRTLMPSLSHALVLGNVRSGKLKQMDVLVRKSLRAWLHLPHDVPIACFHAQIKEGGLGIPALETSIPCMQAARISNLSVCEHWAIKATLLTAAGAQDSRSFSKCPTLDGRTIRTKSDSQVYWRERLHNSVDGRGLQQHGQCPEASAWIADASLPVSGGDFIKAIHVRMATLKTPMRASRGRGIPWPKCRTCPDEVCSLAHILQICGRTHGVRTLRHNRFTRAIIRSLRKQGWLVAEEPRITKGNSYVKPDVVALRKGETLVLDPTIVADNVDLAAPMKQKESKYSCPEVLTYCKNFARGGKIPAGVEGHLDPNVPVGPTKVAGVVLNWRGAVSASAFKTLMQAGVPPMIVSFAIINMLADNWRAWYYVSVKRTR